MSGWETAVTQTANLLNQTLLAPVTVCDGAQFNLEEILALTATSQHELLVIPAPQAKRLPMVLNRTAKPLFFVRGAPTAIQRILVVMRGFASAERALDWLTPFAWQAGTAVTLLPLTNGADLGPYLHPNSPSGQHLERFAPQSFEFVPGLDVITVEGFGEAFAFLVFDLQGGTRAAMLGVGFEHPPLDL